MKSRKVKVDVNYEDEGEHYSWWASTDLLEQSIKGNCYQRRNIARLVREEVSEALDIPQHRIEVVVHR